MAYTINIREQAMGLCQKGHTPVEVSAKTGVSPQTVNNWKKLLFTTGNLQKKKVHRPSGIAYKYKPDKIKELLDKSPKSPQAATSESSKSQSGSLIIFTPSKPKKKDKKKKKKF